MRKLLVGVLGLLLLVLVLLLAVVFVPSPLQKWAVERGATMATGRQVTIGEPFRRVLRVRDVAPIYQVKDPSGGVAEVPSTSEDGVQLIEYAGTAVPGVYALSAMDKDGAQQIPKWQERFAVNTEAAESDVAKVGEDINAVLKEALGETRYEFQKAGGEGENRALMSDDTGGGAWLWCAVIAALFFLAETAWSLFISKPEQ